MAVVTSKRVLTSLAAAIFISRAWAALDDDFPRARRHDGAYFPLVGVGVGNLPRERMDEVVAHALTSDSGYRLFDTGASNEEALADAIDNALAEVVEDETLSVHVVTKIWYTHLGYERTKLAVEESLKNLRAYASGHYIRVHILIHWPRCYDHISWMDCEGEEERLPQHVKDAGPPPHLDKENSWKESWRALQEIYSNDELRRIESIGVSNFDHRDFQTLVDECDKNDWITPHLIQNNVWALMFDPYLMKLVQEEKVIFQAYNTINGIVQRKDVAPNAHKLIEDIGRNIPNRPYSVASVVQAWLVQQNVSIIPRASNLKHQDENSPRSLQKMIRAAHDEMQDKDIDRAVRALLKGEDIEGPLKRASGDTTQKKPDSVSATITNLFSEGSMTVFWKSQEGKEVPAHDDPVGTGDILRLNTHPGHTFVAYSHDGSTRKEFQIEVQYGEEQNFEFGDEL